MPDRDVKTVRDLIYYQYAKIIARSAFKSADGKAAKAQNYGFIKKTFRDLRDGKKAWSEITREDWQFVESDKACTYCGGADGLSREHIVPRSLRIKPECATCETIQGIHNQIWACRSCNSAKGTEGLYAFFAERHPGEKKSYDLLPPLLEKKYLKTVFNCHVCAGTLDDPDLNRDGTISVADIDAVLLRR